MTGVMCAIASGRGVLTTTTFTADGTWVAPAGVTNVVSASGKGAAGTSDTLGTVYNSYFGALQTGTAQANAPYAQWSDQYSAYTTGLSQINKTYPAYGPAVFDGFNTVYIDSSDKWIRLAFSTNLSSTYITGYTTGSNNSPPTSGNITYASTGVIRGWSITVTGYVRGSAGASSTGLGLTFPGGTYTGTYPNAVGNPASTTTFTNVAVTPGTSYPIVVPSGGQITLQYYV